MNARTSTAAAARSGALPTIGAESRAFQRLSARIARTLLRQTFSRAWFRLSLVMLLSAILWGGLLWLFYMGFQFLKSTIPMSDVRDQAVRALLQLFFGSLTVMLVFSSAIILYGALFRSRETAFLLTLPARTERIFLHKFQTTIIFSSWGFLLLGSPVLLAYGLTVSAPWYYYLVLAPFMVAFIYLPSAIGSICCLLLVNYVPRHRLFVASAMAAATLGIAVWMFWSLAGSADGELLTFSWFQELLGRLRYTDQRLTPSWWLSSGLLEAARGQWSESLLFLALIVSNAMLFRQLALWIAARSYRKAYSALYGLENARRQAHAVWLDEAIMRYARFLPLQVRLLIVKDLRLFRRDPVQWLQFLIFFGLLVLYFSNVRRFNHDIQYVGWVNMVSFMNVSVVGLLLSTFNTRFIYPMVSLEGRCFWVLGLLPVRRETILWSKFLFAAIGSMIPSSVLILLSDLMLDVRSLILVSHQLTCVLLSVGLAGIAVGLGAKLPNLREQSPSRIAAGFGGTLNLVISTLYIVLIVLLTALPCHFYFALNGYANLVAYNVGWSGYFYLWLTLGTVLSVLLAAIATAVPLRMGFQAFRRLEF
jgi:ABC-2 type transport system permease protein